MLLRDPALAATIQEAVANTAHATASANHAAGQADTLISDLQARHVSEKVDDVLTSVKSAVKSVRMGGRL